MIRRIVEFPVALVLAGVIAVVLGLAIVGDILWKVWCWVSWPYI